MRNINWFTVACIVFIVVALVFLFTQLLDVNIGNDKDNNGGHTVAAKKHGNDWE